MAFREWRRFNFFDLIDNVDSGIFAEAIQDAKITASTCGHGHLVFADSVGNIHLVDRVFQITTFQAYEYKVDLCEQIRNAPLLITVGGDEPGAYPVIKVWSLEKRDKGGLPTCIRASRATSGGHVAQATALCAHANLELMAIGFSDSSVILYRGDITRDRSVKQKMLGGKDGVSGGGTRHAVTGLAFRMTQGLRCVHLFVATACGVYIYNITVKDKEQRVILDSIGCEKMCSVLAENAQESHYMIGRTDAIYCYTPDGRGPCYVIEGEKVLLQWFRSYLVIVAREEKGTVMRTTATASLQQASKSTSSEESNDFLKHTSNSNNKTSDRCMVNVLDIMNKFIVLSVPMNGVQAVLAEWGSIYILLGGGNSGEPLRLCHLSEKDLPSKLAFLFKKNLYDVSIRIAKSHQYDIDGLVDIFRQYGDHLYSKGDHNAAIEQYIKTIGKLESSYIIRKFLDSQHIGYLTKYLQALHKQGMASEDHTTLLLNCYTKQDSTDKLKEFIMTKDREVDFDVEIAIKVCRGASPEDALLLAQKHDLHHWHLKILIEDQQNYTVALDYIAQLEFEEAEENMKEYGSILVDHVPEQATELLKKLCTDYRPSKKPLVDQNMLDGSVTVPEVKAANAEEYIHLFLNNSERLVQFLEYIVMMCPKSSTQVYNTLVEHYLHVWSSILKSASDKERADEEGKNAGLDVDETLQADRKLLEEKLIRLLENPDSKYDKDQTLILCRLHNFKKGLIFLYEDAKLYQEIINYHAQHGNYASILDCCRKFGHKDLDLWIQALWLCAREPPAPPAFLREVLDVIAKERLLSPLLVVDALSSGSGSSAGMTKLGEIRSFLLSVLSAEGEVTKQERARVAKYQSETKKFREQINDIQTSTIIFQGSRCSACDNQLYLPSIHFLCQHSYHQHCFQSFSENENECPACQPSYKVILDIIESQEQSWDMHESFHSQLDRAEDGFTWVADYFGRGIFNRLTLVTDSPPKTKIPVAPIHLGVGDTRSTLFEGSASKKDLPKSSGFVSDSSRRDDASNVHLSTVSSSSNSGSPRAALINRDNQIPSTKAASSNMAPSIPHRIQLGLSLAQIQYSSSLEANMTRGADIPQKITHRGKSEVGISQIESSLNPFGDEDDNVQDGLTFNAEGRGYDESKNPFAEELNNPFEKDNDFSSGNQKNEDSGNDYDRNLNPFA